MGRKRDRWSDEPTNPSVEPSVWRDPDAIGVPALGKAGGGALWASPGGVEQHRKGCVRPP